MWLYDNYFNIYSSLLLTLEYELMTLNVVYVEYFGLQLFVFGYFFKVIQRIILWFLVLFMIISFMIKIFSLKLLSYDFCINKGWLMICMISIQEELENFEDFFFFFCFFFSFIFCGIILGGYLFGASFFFFSLVAFFFFSLILGFGIYKSYGINVLLRVRGAGRTRYLLVECFFDTLYLCISFIRSWLQLLRFVIILYCFLELYYFLYFEFSDIKVGFVYIDLFFLYIVRIFFFFYYLCHYLIIFTVQLLLFFFMYIILFLLLYTSHDRFKYEVYFK